MKAQEIFKKLSFVAGCAALVCAVSVSNSQAASTSASASGKVISPINISKTTDLNFGSFAASGTAGTVDLTTDGENARTKTGGVTLATGGTVAAAVFHVTGEANTNYGLTMDALTLSGDGGGTMTVALASSLGVGNSGTLSGSGAADITVAGSLSVGANQIPGTYTGTLNVTVEYN